MDSRNIYQPGDFKPVIPTSIHLVHKNGKHRIVRLGFCWTGFFLPTMWAMSEGLWRPFACSLMGMVACRISESAMSYYDRVGVDPTIIYAHLLTTVGAVGYLFTMIYFGFHGKKLLIRDLLRHGYAMQDSTHGVEI